ncbi:hypothetical protein FANTH_13767 [Fusarium anthophilum]|uniref:Protein kinase domain-containing protein n=1 Tax=Fusarium anthophilum TaxID=48485 RepID=A0A8H5DP52_9HYPO|nr:hypothetical protein FANTH_13767 [Fusarium anthophilum]
MYDNLLRVNLLLAPTKEVLEQELDKLTYDVEAHDLKWLLELQEEYKSEKLTIESLSSTGQSENFNTIPSRQIVPALPPLADNKTVADTLPSNIQDKDTTATVEPMYKCAPVGDYNSVVERPRALRKKKITRDPPERARGVFISHFTMRKMEVTDKIIGILGEGSYANVVKASRGPKSGDVAIKISALGEECRDAARKELRILETLKMNDEKNRFIRAQDWFEYQGHTCLVLDLYGLNTYQFLQENKYIPNSQIQSIARQLFDDVACLHDLGIVHADIKPDNLVLCDNAQHTLPYNSEKGSTERQVLKNTEVRLIDFGLSTFIDEPQSNFGTTLTFSAPETWLSRKASFSHDIWSIGCSLVELFTGDILFNTEDMTEYLAMAEAITGLKLEDEISWIADEQFRGILSALLPNAMQKPRKKIQQMKVKNIDQIINPGDDTFLRNFVDLLKRIFVLNPKHRITAKQALQHPCLTEIIPPDGSTFTAESSVASVVVTR